MNIYFYSFIYCLAGFDLFEVFGKQQVIMGVISTFIGYAIHSASLQGFMNVSFKEAFEVSKQLSNLKLQQ